MSRQCPIHLLEITPFLYLNGYRKTRGVEADVYKQFCAQDGAAFLKLSNTVIDFWRPHEIKMLNGIYIQSYHTFAESVFPQESSTSLNHQPFCGHFVSIAFVAQH